MKFLTPFSKSVLAFAAAAVLFTGCDDEDPNPTPDPEPDEEITITGIDPTSGPIGAEVEISGTNFGSELTDHILVFNGTQAEISSVKDNLIIVTVPEGATTGPISLSTQNQTIDGPAFTVTEPDPGITSLRPGSGAPGMEVKINGFGFGDEITDQVVSFNGTEAEIKELTNTQIIAIVPEGVTTGPVTVTIDGETLEGPEFSILEEEVNYGEEFTVDAGIVTVGQSFIYENGGLDEKTALRLVPAKSDRTGAAYYGTKVPVTDGFETTFQFRIARPGLPEGVEGEEGADGFAFIIQNEGLDAIGSRGADMAYGGIENAVVVEFDIYENAADEDPDGNHISIQGSVGGGGPVHADKNYRLAEATSATHPGLPASFIGNETSFHTARVVYEPGLLQVYVDDMETPLEAKINLEDFLNSDDGKAWVGFTASTSPDYGWASFDILNWALSPESGTDTETEEGTDTDSSDSGTDEATTEE